MQRRTLNQQSAFDPSTNSEVAEQGRPNAAAGGRPVAAGVQSVAEARDNLVNAGGNLISTTGRNLQNEAGQRYGNLKEKVTSFPTGGNDAKKFFGNRYNLHAKGDVKKMKKARFSGMTKLLSDVVILVSSILIMVVGVKAFQVFANSKSGISDSTSRNIRTTIGVFLGIGIGGVFYIITQFLGKVRIIDKLLHLMTYVMFIVISIITIHYLSAVDVDGKLEANRLADAESTVAINIGFALGVIVSYLFIFLITKVGRDNEMTVGYINIAFGLLFSIILLVESIMAVALYNKESGETDKGARTLFIVMIVIAILSIIAEIGAGVMLAMG